MQPGPYFDIHTHKETSGDNTTAIINRHERFDDLDKQKMYSLGVHPWYITDAPGQLRLLEQYMLLPNVMAIGECGLDKICDTDFHLQEKVFRRQVMLAEQIRKPLIIHCVKAFPEVLDILKETTVPVVFHGFNKRQTIAVTILQRGYYLSFGRHLLNINSSAAATFASVPPESFLLETDTGAENITAIYKAAVGIRKTGEDAIILQAQNNFKKVFGK